MSGRRGGAVDAVRHGVWTGVGTALGGLLVLMVLLWLFGDEDDDASIGGGGGLGTLEAGAGSSADGCGWL